MIGSFWADVTSMDLPLPSRGPKTVAPDVYEGPDVNASSGTYVPFSFEGPDVDAETGAHATSAGALILDAIAPRAPGSVAPRAATPAAGLPWGMIAAGAVALGTIGYFVLRRRGA